MKKTAVCLLAGLLAGFTFNAAAADAPDMKFGLQIQIDITTFARAGEQGQIPAERFAPTALDAKNWAHAAREAGVTFAVLSAKLDSGFCLWDSKDSDYDIGHSAYKGDIIGDFIAGCNAEGILPGLQYSIADIHEGMARTNKESVPATYFALIKKHLTDLHTRYPGIRIQMLNFSAKLSPDQLGEIRDLIKRLNPGCVFPGEGGVPPFDSNPIFNGWIWKPQARVYPVQTLFDHYNSAQQTKQSYLLNVGPDTTGRIPNDQIAVLMQLKGMIAAHSSAPPPAGNQGQPSAADRLKQLKALHDQGLINQDEYDRKSKEIIDSL